MQNALFFVQHSFTTACLYYSLSFAFALIYFHHFLHTWRVAYQIHTHVTFNENNENVKFSLTCHSWYLPLLVRSLVRQFVFDIRIHVFRGRFAQSGMMSADIHMRGLFAFSLYIVGPL